jgi:hypothetical protein
MLSLVHDGRSSEWFERLGAFDFKVPDNLIIFTSHNLEDSLFERQMRLQNCTDYKVIKPNFNEAEMAVISNENYQNFNNELSNPHGESGTPSWSNVFRLRYHLEFLKSDECSSKKYVLFCDASDVLFLDSPEFILNSFLNNFSCSLLYNGGYWAAWHYYTESKKSEKTRQFAVSNGGVHLNAGVYIGEKDFIIKVYEDVLSYVTDDVNIRREMLDMEKDRPWEGLNFPFGSPSDQLILRYLQLDYHPELQVDREFKLMARLTYRQCFEKGVLDLGKFNNSNVFRRLFTHHHTRGRDQRC